MKDAIFSKLEQLGFQGFDSGFCVGTWKNYAVTLRRYAGRTYYVNLAIRGGKQYQGLKKTLNGAIKAAGIKKSAVANVQPNTILATFSFSGGAENEIPGFTAYLNVLTETLAQNGVGPANTCAVTGAANPDSLCFIAKNDCFGYQPVCGSAVRQSGYEAQASVEENENNGSYLTGLIGAVLGMLVGIGFNLLTMVFLGYYFSALFALVPIAAMFGYKLFKGKTDKISLVIVIVLSVIAVPLMIFLDIALSIVKEQSVPLSKALSWTAGAFQEDNFLREILPDMLKMLLFMVLGIFIGWGFISRQLNSSRIKGSQLQMDSMRPNPLFSAAQGQFAQVSQTQPAEEQAIPQPTEPQFSQPGDPQQ